MAAEAVNALDSCKQCIDLRKSFILQGGAGSGKTESLKELLLYIKQTHPDARVICITHTNAAVDEIISRVGDRYTISTIHSFLYKLIGHYKKNIKSVISELFCVPHIIRAEQDESTDETKYKKDEHEKYKKIYGKYANKLYSVCRENCDKVVGKREYDKDPVAYNQALNNAIDILNTRILELIGEKDYSKIYYNETKFDNLNELSYGHDGLLVLFHLLFTKYPLIGKIVADKYDYIFIDEYQDTRADVLTDILSLSQTYNLTVGLFGDSMQSIYEDGIGNIDEYIQDSTLQSIPKPDNFRCSHEVINLINTLRLDDIQQNVALKKLGDGTIESDESRHGSVRVLYSVVDKKPHSHSTEDEKDAYQLLVNSLISKARENTDNSKVLILTNKAIAEKNGFKNLYKIFDDRYVDVSDRIEKYLRSIQALDVSELCHLYLTKDYNSLINLVKKGGYVIHTVADKKNLHDILESIISNQEASIKDIVEFAVDAKLIKRTETNNNILSSNANFLEQLLSDTLYQEFKRLYLGGQHTFSRISNSMDVSSEEEFKHLESLYKKERFLTEIFSSTPKFIEVLNYTRYLNEETEYITMHKTKGTSIPSVIVVMEEYFWNEYDFSLLYKPDENKQEKKINSQRLIYVACSRAKNDLTCIKILTAEEVPHFLQLFPQAELVSI